MEGPAEKCGPERRGHEPIPGSRLAKTYRGWRLSQRAGGRYWTAILQGQAGTVQRLPGPGGARMDRPQAAEEIACPRGHCLRESPCPERRWVRQGFPGAELQRTGSVTRD